jgi:hypothetical protein
MMESLAFIALGFLLYGSADWLAHLFSDSADKCERDGVIRFGGGLPGNKVWREDSPKKFESRIQRVRFSAAFSRLLLKGAGAVFVVGGIGRILGSLVR